MGWRRPAEACEDQPGEGARVQGGAHSRRDLTVVVGGQLAPVERRAKVVGGVVAVVEEEPVGDFPSEIPRVIVVRAVLAILMLEEIHADKGELCGDPGEDEEERGRTEIHD